MTYWNDLRLHDGGSDIEQIWYSHPLVREEINRCVSGDPRVWPTEWLSNLLAPSLPFPSSVVVGCGTGALERDLISRGIVARVIGLDLVPAPVDRARQSAAAAGIADRVEYAVADANTYLAERRGQFDAVFFHGSLHHFFDPRGTLTIVRDSLRPAGVLYLDEYVGPSRDQWSALRLALPNLAYRLVGRRLRRPHLVRAPINRLDPSEAPASDQILPAVRALFDILALRPYGGNLLSVIYPNLHRPPAVTADVLSRGVRRLIGFEQLLLRMPAVRPYHAVVVARKRDQRGGAGS